MCGAHLRLQGFGASDDRLCVGRQQAPRLSGGVLTVQGGALAAGAVLTRTELLLPVIGAVFVAEAVSVILQVASFKTTGRRIFRMSPLHHHFELGGWPETRVVRMFWTAGIIAGLAGLWIVLASAGGRIG